MPEILPTSIRYFAVVTLMGILAIASTHVLASDIDEIKYLSRAGATTLALHLLDERQQAKNLSPDQWVLLEKERGEIQSKGL